MLCALLVVASGSASLQAATVSASKVSISRVDISTLRVGDLNLRRCAEPADAWCGSLRVPLDWSDADAPQITVGFEFYPARSGSVASAGTIAPIEGGPGYASTDSRSEFLGIYNALRGSNNVLLFDRRGTGRSSVVKCAALQGFKTGQSRFQYLSAARACGVQLDTTFRYAGGPRQGQFVRASALYGTDNAVQDFAAVLDALGFKKIDLYGDSYGTYFAQVFSARYPARLRSLTLDSSYAVRGLDPWYPTALATAKNAFTLACQRSAICAATRANTERDLERLAMRLRVRPLTGQYRDPTTEETVTRTVDIKALLQLVIASGSTRLVLRDLGAAARGLLDRGDPQPLLRVYAETISHSDSGPYTGFSSGLFAAATCADYPQLYALTGTQSSRERQFEASINAWSRPRAFAPFTAREWAWMRPGAYDTQPLYTCLAWPALPASRAPLIAPDAPLAPKNLPVLVLSGDFDSITTPADNRAVTAQLGSLGRLVTLVNTVHVTTYNNPSDCGSALVRGYVRNPASLAGLDATCASRVPEIKAVGAFVTRTSQARAAVPLRGNRVSTTDLQLAAVAVATAGDALFRYNNVYGDIGVGLRGGTWQRLESSTDERLILELKSAQWVEDARVSGIVTLDLNSGAVTARLRVNGSSRIGVRWNDRAARALATISGQIAGRQLRARMPAP